MLIEHPVALADLQRLALGGELHADDEAFLLDRGSEQRDLWGINIHPFRNGDGRVEFDSLINIRPAAGNLSRSVEAEATRRRILAIVRRLVRKS